MRKPWSFKAIEFLTYFQIGLAQIVICHGILLLIAHEMKNYTIGLLPTSISASIFWTFFVWLTGYAEAPKGIPDIYLSATIWFLLELMVSGVFLMVLKTKSFVVIRRMAVIALSLRITMSGYLTKPAYYFYTFLNGYTFIFILGSVLVFACLYLKPVQDYILVRSQQKIVMNQ